MTYRVLAVWFSLSVAIGAFAQGTVAVEYFERPLPRIFMKVSRPLDVSLPRLIRHPEDREYKIRRYDEVLIMGPATIDTSRPDYCSYTCIYVTPEGDSAKVSVFVNPTDETLSFDVTKDFETTSLEGTKHCIRGNQRFTQTTLRNSYEGPFVAMFLGAFTMPYIERYPQRIGGCWGPADFVTASTYTAYDASKRYNDVQSICILIEGDPKLTELIMNKIKVHELNEAIERE